MKLVVNAPNSSEWLVSMSPPPIKISQAKLAKMNEQQRAELDAANNRRIIDPCRVNVFSDPAREALRVK